MIYIYIYDSQTRLSIKIIRKFLPQILCFFFLSLCNTYTHWGSVLGQIRYVSRIQSNIEDGAFCEKKLTGEAVDYFGKNIHFWCVTKFQICLASAV